MTNEERLAHILKQPRAYVCVHPDTLPALREAFKVPGGNWAAVHNDVKGLRVYTHQGIAVGDIVAIDPDGMTPDPWPDPHADDAPTPVDISTWDGS